MKAEGLSAAQVSALYGVACVEGREAVYYTLERGYKPVLFLLAVKDVLSVTLRGDFISEPADATYTMENVNGRYKILSVYREY